MSTHRVDTIAGAADIMMDRWSLSRAAATAAIADIAEETGVDVEDLAALIAGSEHRRVSGVSGPLRSAHDRRTP